MVIVVTGGNLSLDDIAAPLLASIRPAAIDENPAAVARLTALTKAAAQAPHSRAAAPARLPPRARALRGKVFTLEPNPLGMMSVSFNFGAGRQAGMAAQYVDGSSAHFVIGPDGAPAIAPTGRFGLRAAAQGRWASADRFVLDLDEIANINAWHIDFVFGADGLRASISERDGKPVGTLRGFVRRPA
jgi:hypothetical protein